jgi:regulator of RNase E activity RraA|tara:strand:- start:2955 stop:3608 length:654 start_codon:yes stop_codon:yes gene_type:complete
MNNIELADRFQKCFSSVVHDVMRNMGFKQFTLPPTIKPIKQNHKICSQIFTVEGEVGKTFTHHETLLAWTGLLSKAPKEKIIICQPNNQTIALMGELSAETLQDKKIRGYIVDGGCRDLEFILNIDFPVWCKFFTPLDVVGYWKPTHFEQTITIGDVSINNNDYALADIDGVVIIPLNHAEEILLKSEELVSTENLVRKAIKEGMDPQEAYLKYSVF